MRRADFLVSLLMPLQWGRDRTAAEMQGRSRNRAGARQASMGPRPYGRGNQEAFCRYRIAGLKLQWGRDRTAAEMSEPAHFIGYRKLASMGPRPYGRGNVVTYWQS